MDSDSSHSLEVTIESAKWRKVVTEPRAICRRAMLATLAAEGEADHAYAVSLVLSDDRRVAALNGQWRGKVGPTNVLSFPAPELPTTAMSGIHRPLGDIIVAVETVCAEATAEGKAVADHLSHLVVHGTLHLLGHDHEEPAEAELMEGLERRILATIGVPDPYVEGMPT